MQLTSYLPLLLQRVKLRAILYMILSALGFSFLELVALKLVEGITLYQVVWTRYAFHMGLMVVVLGPHYKTRVFKTSNLSLQILRSLTMLAMPVGAILATQQYMPPQDMWSAYWVSPIIMLLLSTFILREPAGMTRWIMVLIGFVGMMLILQPSQAIFSRGFPLAFSTGVAVSLHLLFSRMLRKDHPLASLFHTALWVFVVLSFFIPTVLVIPSLRTVAALIIIAAAGLVTLFALAKAGELSPIPVVATFSFTEAIWRLLINVLILGVLPDKLALLGTLIITVVTGYMFFYELRQPDTESEVKPALKLSEALPSET